MQMVEGIKNSKKNVVIAAGGTGGHIFPAMCVALQLLDKHYKVTFVTDNNFDRYSKAFEDVLSRWNFTVKYVHVKPTYNVLQRIMQVPRVLLCIALLFGFFWRKKINLVIGFGSYVSLPSIIAGFLCGCKTMLHEQNTIIGISNRLAIWFCNVGLLGFSEVGGVPRLMRRKMIFVGNPVRDEVKDLHYQNVSNIINYEAFYKIYHKIHIFVIGGSQGAESFANFVPQAICSLPSDLKAKLCIFHQAPEKDVEVIKKMYEDNLMLADVRKFFYNVPEIMSKSHLVIGRSGAITIAELLVLGAPSILIPMPWSANNHQVVNAKYLANRGACVLVEQGGITAQKLSSIISHLLRNEHELSKMSANAKQICEAYAAEKVVEMIDGLLGNKNIDDVKQTAINKINYDNIGIT